MVKVVLMLLMLLLQRLLVLLQRLLVLLQRLLVLQRLLCGGVVLWRGLVVALCGRWLQVLLRLRRELGVLGVLGVLGMLSVWVAVRLVQDLKTTALCC